MLQVGSLVKPKGRNGTWRLGVVEEVLDDGSCRVRYYVAPEGAYAGAAAGYRADELVEVPRKRVEGFLQVTRVEADQKLQLARQIEAALGAATKD